MRGRKPKPTQLHIINGNPSRRPLNDAEPKPERGRPKCPAWLDPIAKTKWRQVVPLLDKAGILTVIDGDTLASYCTAWAELVHATETLTREGRIVDGTKEGTRVVHPAVANQRTAWKAIKDFSALFGLDPSSRARLKVEPPKPDDPLGDFLNEQSA